MTKDDNEESLFLWVRVIGAVVLISTTSVAMLAIIIAPIFVSDYHVESSTVVGLGGLMLASGLALIEVSVRLRRNGWNIDTKPDSKKDKKK